ncbi:MAG: preprotein translocase subunit SecD [Clostridiales bacterium]|jgi:protein-export SecD/SecF family membrane protein|nr:preprotein translocase subunit SecD [Clostridiales bacterium]
MAKRSFARAGVKAKPVTFFIVSGIILLALLLTWTGLTIPVPGSDDFIELYGAKDIRFGIDIVGGVEAVFAPEDFEGTPSSEDLASARSVLELRMDNLQILDREITVERGKGRIIVRFPWKSGETEFNPEEALMELGEMAKLTFRDPDGNVVLDGADISKSMAAYNPDNNEPIVSLEMTSEGANKFGEATEKLIGQPISIYMDETMISSPTVNQAIYNGKAVIENIGSAEEAIDLAEKINAGALPFGLEAVSSSTISPTMGRNALNVMLQAGLIAFIAICAFMLLYYRLPGFVACLALLGQVTGILLAIAIPQQTLTLQGIAGIILSIGMGVDANVIIAERIKEELNAGCSLPTAISNGFTRAFSAVLDGNVTVAIAAIILMIFGSGSMLSFGYSLLTGVILNALTGVTASRLMIGALSSMKPFRKVWLYGKRRAAANV